MTLLSSLKPFWPILFTFVLPRAIGYYRALKTAVRTRPPPRPLPPKTSQGLNALFASICVFLLSSLPRNSLATENVFVTTGSRLHIPTDVLFARLALARPNGVLTAQDEELRTKLTTPILRQTYLRFGPSTLLNCSFCQPDDTVTYLLHFLPTTILLPHLFHFLAIGLSTSETISGFSASRWRFPALLGATALLLIDLYLTTTYTPSLDANMPSPTGLFWTASLIRPLTLCAYDSLLAFAIYASATGRFILFPTASDAADPELRHRRAAETLNQSNVTLQMALTKMRAFSVARNAVVRDAVLKGVDDRYWRDVVGVEAPNGMDEGVWQDEDVQASMARVYGTGVVDVARMRKDADAFVRGVTVSLDE